jgi:hypothetical protein
MTKPTKIRRQLAGRLAVDRIETAPMTATQRQQAVSALTTLIARWEQTGRPTSQRDDTGSRTVGHIW